MLMELLKALGLLRVLCFIMRVHFLTGRDIDKDHEEKYRVPALQIKILNGFIGESVPQKKPIVAIRSIFQVLALD